MRFIYFGDVHERLTPPENRIDNYNQTLVNKTEEINQLGEKYKVSGYLQPGDFWDTPNPPLDFAKEVIKQWTKVDAPDIIKRIVSGENVEPNELIKSIKTFRPIIGVVGNHELHGNNINTLDKTMAGFVSEINQLGLINYVAKDNPYYFYTEDGLKVAITGSNYHINGDTPERINDYIVEEKLGDIHIHICHGMLSDKSLGKMIKHTLIDQIKHTKADLTLCGHDHLGFGVIEIEGKYFANIGGVTRIYNNLKEMKRKPKVLLIDITKENGIKLKEIPLKSAEKGELVLSRKKIIQKQSKETRMEEWKKIVRDAGLKKSCDITSIINDIGRNKCFDDRMIQTLIDDVSKKIESMGNCINKPCLLEGYITEIILENFQSHEYTVLECSKGLNMFIGESGRGKSAILRALGFVYENRGKSRRMIKRGKDFARVTIKLSNGYVVARYVEKKKSGKNGYEIYYPNTGETEYHNTKILPEVQEILGYRIMNIDKDIQPSVNFLRQGTGWFLISEQYSAPQRLKIIGGVYGTQYADAVMRDLDREEKQINGKTKGLEEGIEKIDKEIEEFSYLEDLKDNINKVTNLLQKVNELKEKRDKIEAIVNKKKALEYSLSEINRTIKETVNISKSIEELAKLKDLYQKRRYIINRIDKRCELIEFIQKQKFLIKKTQNVQQGESLIKELYIQLNNKKDKLFIFNRLKTIEINKHACQRALSAIGTTIKVTSDIDRAMIEINQIQSLIVRRNKIKDIINQEKSFSNLIEEENKKIKSSKIQLNKDVAIFKGLLKQIGKCPVCLSNIDDITVDRIIADKLVHEI